MFERFAEGKKKLEARLGIEQKAVLQIGLANVGLLILRIFGEEKLLARDLEGYKEYLQKVRYRLVPHVW